MKRPAWWEERLFAGAMLWPMSNADEREAQRQAATETLATHPDLIPNGLTRRKSES